MCVTSMVFDYYQGPFHKVYPTWPTPLTPPEDQLTAEMRQLIAEFREAVAAAKAVDRLTGQTDCADPEKAKLEERVRRLEEMLGMGAGG